MAEHNGDRHPFAAVRSTRRHLRRQRIRFQLDIRRSSLVAQRELLDERIKQIDHVRKVIDQLDSGNNNHSSGGGDKKSEAAAVTDPRRA